MWVKIDIVVVFPCVPAIAMQKLLFEIKPNNFDLFNSLNLWREVNNAPIPFEKNIKYDQKFVDSINLLIIDGKLSGRINTNW